MAFHLKVGFDVASCCGNARVTQIISYHGEVSPRLKKSNSTAVPHDMGCHPLPPKSGFLACRRSMVLADDIRDAVAGERFTASIPEDRPIVWQLCPLNPTTSLILTVKFMKPFLSVREICTVILFLYPPDKRKRHFGVVLSQRQNDFE
jgi:hypothetical protein